MLVVLLKLAVVLGEFCGLVNYLFRVTEHAPRESNRKREGEKDQTRCKVSGKS